jgi:hypothetical protein
MWWCGWRQRWPPAGRNKTPPAVIVQGEGLQTLLAEGQVKGMWTPEFAANAKFTGDPVCVVPDVREVDTTPQVGRCQHPAAGSCCPCPSIWLHARHQIGRELLSGLGSWHMLAGCHSGMASISPPAAAMTSLAVVCVVRRTSSC